MILTPEGFRCIHSKLVVLPFPCFVRVILLITVIDLIVLLIVDAVVVVALTSTLIIMIVFILLKLTLHPFLFSFSFIIHL